MTPIERLIALVGSKAKLADICGVDPSMVTRWVKTGHLPTKYNRDVQQWAMVTNPTVDIEGVMACLDPHVCPTCGHPIDDGRVL